MKTIHGREEMRMARMIRYLGIALLGGGMLLGCSDIMAPEGNLPESVQISSVGVVQSLNEEVSLTARVFDLSGREIPGASLVWEIADPEILVEVRPGLFRSIANGSTTVRARVRSGRPGVSPDDSYLSGTGPAAEILIRVQQVPARIDFGTEPLNLWSVNQVRPLSAVVVDAMGTPVVDAPPIVWTTNGGGVVTIDEEGRVRAVGDGATTIVASAGGLTATSPVAVYSTIPYETCFSFSTAGSGNPLGQCATINIRVRELE